MPGPVATAFAGYPPELRDGLEQLRALILERAAALPETGGLEESLRWGQPAYLTKSGSGSTIRLGLPKAGGYALFVHCRTSLIEDFRPLAPTGTRFDGTRAVLFEAGERPDMNALALLVDAALTYHLGHG